MLGYNTIAKYAGPYADAVKGLFSKGRTASIDEVVDSQPKSPSRHGLFYARPVLYASMLLALAAGCGGI